MNKVKLLIIVLSATLMCCKAKTRSNKIIDSSVDINSELKKNSVDPVTFYLPIQLDSIVNTLINDDTIGTTLGASQDSTPYMLTVRTKPGYAEIHEQFDDVAIIRSGHGTLKTGYQVIGNSRLAGAAPSRNWFCDSIKDATVRKLSPGDFFIIPAMTAHQYIPDSGDTLSYWTIKVKRLKNNH